MPKYCKSCGTANPDHATTCLRCCKPLGHAYYIGPSMDGGEKKQQKQLPTKRIVGGIAAVFIAVFIGILLLFPTSFPLSTDSKPNEQEEKIIEKASEFLREKGFTSFSYKSNDENIVTFEVNQDFEYARLSGEISVNASQRQNGEGQTNWVTEICQSENCLISWNMDKLCGEWYAEEEDYELFSGTYTNTHSLTITGTGNTIDLYYEKMRGYNGEIKSWSGSLELPSNYDGLEAYIIDADLLNKYVGAPIEGIYNIKVSVQIGLSQVAIIGYNAVDQQTLNIEMEKQS